MATAAEVRKAFQATAAEFTRWEKAGLPSSGSGRRKTYDLDAVHEWLVAAGHRKPATKRVPRLKDVALHFGKSERTIQNWKDRGMPFGNDGYDLIAIETWRNEEFGDSGDEDDDESRGYWETRKAKADALTNELKLAEKRGKLIDVEVPSREFGAFLVEARAVLEQLPDWLLAQLPKKFPAAERKALLEKARGRVAEVLGNLKKALEKKATSTRNTPKDDA